MALIGLLFLAGNVEAACPRTPCTTSQFCWVPGAMGICYTKKKGGESTDKAYKCFSNILKDGICGCTAQTGNYGCKNSIHYCENNKCVVKKKSGETCSLASQCFSNKCTSGRCECTSQTGNTGCKSDEYCDKTCLKKKGVLAGCSSDQECKSDKCWYEDILCKNLPRTMCCLPEI